MRKTLLIFILMINVPLIFTLLQGCGPDCGPTNLKVEHIEVLPAKKVFSNSGVVIWDLLEGQSVIPRFDSLILVSYINVSEVLALKRMPYAAFACDPVVNYLDVLEDINLYSNQDYNDQYPKGTNLNSLCVFGINNRLPEMNKQDFIDQVNQYGLGSDNFLIALSATPTSSEDHRITIALELASGETLDYVIDSVPISL